MKYTTIILIIIVFIATTINYVSAKNYDEEIKLLQEEIEKIKYNNRNINVNFLQDFKINGRLHLDAILYKNHHYLNDSGYYKNKFTNKFSIRRARLNITKKINNFTFYLEENFDKDRAYLGQAYISYDIDKNQKIKFGQVLIPSFIETEKSSNSMPVIDYSAFNNWIPDYLIGINYVFIDDNFGLSTGFFGNSTKEESTLNTNMRNNFSLRNYYSFTLNNSIFFHLGFDLMYQKFSSDNTNINNSINKIKNNYLYGFEFGLQYNNVVFVAEYIKMFNEYRRNTAFNGKTFNFDGFYSELVVSLTGEKVIYNKSGYFNNGKILKPLSKGGYGGFESVLRYSYSDGKNNNGNIKYNILGSKYDYTAGINWLPEDNIKILFHYSKIGLTDIDYNIKGNYDLFKIEFRFYF